VDDSVLEGMGKLVWCMVYGIWFFDRLIGLRSRVCVEGGIEGRVEVGICCRGKEGWSESDFYRFCILYLGYIRGYLNNATEIQICKSA